MARSADAAALRRDERLEGILAASPVIPVLTLQRAADAPEVARALVCGGLPALEVTLRTPAAPEAIAAITRAVPEAIVGVGTVLDGEDLAQARALGARFAVSPGATAELLDAAAAGTLPFLPGVHTASEVMAALQRSFRILKFFPAVAAGGPAALRALAGPFPQVRFCPTGGITEDTLAAWLALPNVAAVGGSWLAPPALIDAGDWAAITARAETTRKAARAAMRTPA
jgi:2-dehydro-3-deoxyphosphogluconate aldolase/(4S)-4-hydroxy-2-oxoglutarate aldolase